MKFQQLKIGQRFKYQGNVYVKHSALIAIHAKSGEQKLIPRYASIVVTNAAPTSEDKKPARHLDSNQVLSAFGKFYDCYLDSLQELKPLIDAQALQTMQNNLEAARQRFFNELGLTVQAINTP